MIPYLGDKPREMELLKGGKVTDTGNNAHNCSPSLRAGFKTAQWRSVAYHSIVAVSETLDIAYRGSGSC